MKNWRLILLIIIGVAGLALMIWGSIIMRNHEGFVEIWKAARSAAKPQFVSGIILMVIAYMMTYVKK